MSAEEALEVQRLARGEVVEIRVRFQGEERSHALVVEHTAAEAAHRLGQALDGFGLDLLGHSTHGWRFEDVDVDQLVEDLDPAVTLALVRVPAAVVRVTIEVTGDRPFRFQAPVSTVVPASALVAHLVRWLGLRPDAPWRLSVGGRALSGFDLLAHHGVGEGTAVVLSG